MTPISGVDDRLIERAVRLGNFGDKEAAVGAALRYYVAHLRKVGTLSASGAPSVLRRGMERG